MAADEAAPPAPGAGTHNAAEREVDALAIGAIVRREFRHRELALAPPSSERRRDEAACPREATLDRAWTLCCQYGRGKEGHADAGEGDDDEEDAK